MLSLAPLIISRIRDQVPGFTTVGNASLLVGPHGIGPLLPGCFVIPGAGDPLSQSPNTPLNLEEQHWDIVIIVSHQHGGGANGSTETVAGGLMLGVLRALHGWEPKPTPMAGAFFYKGRLAPVYNEGFAEFPLTFTAKLLLGLPS